MQYTMIYMPKDMSQHALSIRNAIASRYVQFITIGRVVLILCKSSK